LLPLAIACLTMLLLCSVFSLNNPSAPLLVLLSLLLWLGVPAFVAWRQLDHLRRTLYAITDRRALILSVGQPQRTESYPPQRIEFVHAVPRPGGSGDLFFTLLRGTGARRPRYKHGFLDIPQVEQVARIMRQALASKPAKG
jgi:hypothetical protein